MRKLTYFIAASIDGFIGDPNGDGELFSEYLDEEYMETLSGEYPETIPTHVRKMVGLDHRENQRFDTIIQGRASYEVALRIDIPSPFAHMRQFVASRTLGESPDPAVEIVSDDLVGRVRELKREESPLDIYLCGGAQIAGALIDEVDELVIKSYPVVLGSGMPMFRAEFGRQEFALERTRSFKNGVVVREYRRA